MDPGRIFVAGLGHESCGFTPLRTGLAEFRRGRGRPWLDAAAHAGGVVAGALAVCAAAGIEVEPGTSAWAGVSGLVTPAAWAALRAELLVALDAAAGPGEAGRGLAGVFLELHGSLGVEGVPDAQGELLAAVRARVGPGVPVVCALDLHACLTPRMVAAADAFVGYRTAPHRDQEETGRRAATLLLRMLRERRRPARAQVRVPLLLPGEFAQTETPPMAALWSMASALEQTPGVWSVSLLDGFPWVDAAHNEASVLAVADHPEQAELVARALAGVMWALRADFYRSVPALPVPAGLAQAAAWAASGGAVVLSDCGDNPTAGAPQDRADIVAALRTAGVQRAVVALLIDAPAVATARAAGEGAAVEVRLGGTLDPASPRTDLAAVVERLAANTAAGDVAVLRAGGLRVVVGERRLGMTHPGFLRDLGIEPLVAGQILVLKIGYLFPAYADAVRACPGARALLLQTPGATSLDPCTFPYRHVTRPIFPLDGDGTAPLWGLSVEAGGPLTPG